MLAARLLARRTLLPLSAQPPLLLAAVGALLVTLVVALLFPPFAYQPSSWTSSASAAARDPQGRAFGGGSPSGASDALLGLKSLTRRARRHPWLRDVPPFPSAPQAPPSPPPPFTMEVRATPPSPDYGHVQRELIRCQETRENERGEQGKRIIALERDVARLKRELKEARAELLRLASPPEAPPPEPPTLVVGHDGVMVGDLGDTLSELVGHVPPPAPALPPPPPPTPVHSAEPARAEVQRVLRLAADQDRRHDAFPIAAVVTMDPVDDGAAVSELAAAAAVFRAIPFFERVAVAIGSEFTSYFGDTLKQYIEKERVSAHVVLCPSQPSYACAAEAMERLIADDGALLGAFAFTPSFHFDAGMLPAPKAGDGDGSGIYGTFWDARDVLQESAHISKNTEAPPPPDVRGKVDEVGRDNLAKLAGLTLNGSITTHEARMFSRAKRAVAKARRAREEGRRWRRRLAEGPPPPPAPPPPSPPPDPMLELKQELYGARDGSARYDAGHSDTWHSNADAWRAGRRFECSYSDAQVGLLLEASDMGVDGNLDWGAGTGTRLDDERAMAKQYVFDARTWSDVHKSGALMAGRTATAALCARLPKEAKDKRPVLTRSACFEADAEPDLQMCVPPPREGGDRLCGREYADRMTSGATDMDTDVPIEWEQGHAPPPKMESFASLACATWSEAYYVPRVALVPLAAVPSAKSEGEEDVAGLTREAGGEAITEVSAWREATRALASEGAFSAAVGVPTARRLVSRQLSLSDAYDDAVKIGNSGDMSALDAYLAEYPNAKLRTHSELEHAVVFSHERFNAYVNETRFEDARAREGAQHVATGT